MSPGRVLTTRRRLAGRSTRRSLLIESAGALALFGAMAWWRTDPERLVGLACFSSSSAGDCRACCGRLPRLPGGSDVARRACEERCDEIVGLPGSSRR